MAVVQYSLFLLTLVYVIWHVQGSGSLYDPPNRAVMWKYGYITRKNYNYMQLNCGGEKQLERGPYKCGICGDPYNGKKDHEDGGKYGTKMPSRYYPAGIKEMPVKVELLAFEKGFFEFRLCNADVNNVTQECLDENILPIKEGYLAGTPLRFFPKGAGDFRLTVAIPPNLSCNRCVLQWRYHTANSWGTDPKTNKQGIGLGPQEEFRNCADIRIGGEIPNSVRDNPFFAPPDARKSSSIDKPTDQRRRMAFQNRTISVNPTSVDHLSLNTRALLHGTGGRRGMIETNFGTISSGSGQGALKWVDGTANKEKINPMRVPDIKNGGKKVSTTQITKDRMTERINLMPRMTNSIASTDKSQTIIQNDLNAKQLNGLFSLDNILHGTSKELRNGGMTASKGSVKLVGVHSKSSGGHSAKETGSKVGQVKIKDRQSGGQIMHGTTFTERVDGQLQSGIVKGKTSSNTGKKMQTSAKNIHSGTGQQFLMDNSQTGTNEYMDGQRMLLNDVMQRTSGMLGAGKEGQTTNIFSIGSSIGQEKAVDNRIIGKNNMIDIAGGAVGPAPKPEKKASIIVQGARISKTSTAETVPMKAATRSGFSLERDAGNNQNIQNDLERSLTGSRFIDLTKTGGHITKVITRQSDKTQATGATDKLVTDLNMSGSRSNALTDKVNTNSRSFVQQVAPDAIDRRPIEMVGTRTIDMNMQNLGSKVNFGEQLMRTADNSQASNIGEMTTRTGQRIASVHSIDTGASGGQNKHSESPLTISALQPKNGRQRIFLVRASRPQGVMLSSSAKQSDMGMTISEGIQPGTGIARKAIGEINFQNEKTSSAGSNMALSQNNNQLDMLAIGTDQLPSDVLLNSLNPLSSSNIVTDGSAFASMTVSEVIDPLRTQTQRSDGMTISEQDILPKGTSISESKTQSTSGQATVKSGNVLNDVDAFRNELVKSSLRQSGAIITDKPVAKSKANVAKDAASTIKSSNQQIEFSNSVGTNLLASNEVGGKSEPSLDQTVSELLNEAQKILSSTTNDISKAQAVTTSSSNDGKTVLPKSDVSKGLQTEIKSPAFTSSEKIPKPSLASHHSSMSMHSSSLDGIIKQSPSIGITQNTKAKTTSIEAPLQLSREHLLSKKHGSKTDNSGHLVVGAHIQGKNPMHVGNIKNGAVSNNELLSSNIDTTLSLNISPDIYEPSIGAKPIQSTRSHSNVVDVNLRGTQHSERTSKGVIDSNTNNAHTRREKNIQASRKDFHNVNNDINRHASVLSNLDIIGPGTGIVLPTIGSNEASNIYQENSQQAEATTIDQARIIENRPMDSQLDNSFALQDISTTKGGRLGGNVLDFSSNSNANGQLTRNTDRQEATVVNELNSITTGQTKVGNGRSGGESMAQPTSRSSRRQSSIDNSNIGTAGNVKRIDTITTSRNRVVDETVSSETGRRRVIEGNNRIAKTDRSGPSPPKPIQTRRRDSVNIERQINSFNLDNIPGNSVIGTGVQMAGDGGMTAGFGPRDIGVPGDLMLEERRLISTRDGQGRLDRGIITGSRTSEGSFVMTRDPRTGIEGRLQVGDHRRTDNVMTGDMAHSHGSESNNPVYFLDMTQGSSPGSKRIDSMTINELPQTDGGRILSDMRVIDPVDGRGRIDVGRQSNVDRGMRTRDRRIDNSNFDVRTDSIRRTDGSQAGTAFDVGLDISRSAPTADLRRQPDNSRARLSGSSQFGFRDGSRRATEFDRSAGSFDVGTVGLDSVSGEGIGRGRSREDSRRLTERDQRMGSFDVMAGNSREATIGFTDAASGIDSSMQTDRSLGSRSSGLDSGFRDRGFGFDSGRRLEGEGRIAGFDVEPRGPDMANGISTGVRESGSRFDSRRHREDGRRAADVMIGRSDVLGSVGGGLTESSSRRTRGDRRGTAFDTRIGAPDVIDGVSTRFREDSSRLDTRIRTRGERRGADSRLGASDAVFGESGRFREGVSRIDSTRRTVGERAVAEGGGRIDGIGVGEVTRTGSSRLDSRGRMEGERRGSGFEDRMRGSGVSGSDGMRRDSSRGMSRGERVSGTSRDGTFISTGRRDIGSRGTSSGRTLDASRRIMMPGGFPSAMPSFGGSFSPPFGPGPMIGRPGMPFGGSFPSMDPAFGPSLGASSFFPGMGPPGMGPGSMGPGFMGPSGMGPSMGMPPPFSPMPFGPGGL